MPRSLVATALSVAVSALLTPLAALAQPTIFNVSTSLKEGGKPAAVLQIGNFAVRTATNNLGCEFLFGSGRGFWLDKWYDFRWVTVERFYTVNGQTVRQSRRYGPLPAIAPQALGGPGGDDGYPFQHNSTEWKERKRRGESQHFREEGSNSNLGIVLNEPDPPCNPPTPPCTAEIEFNSFLVAVDVNAKDFAANEMLVISGFEWTHTVTRTATGRTDSTTVGAQLDAAHGKALINAALANASPAFLPPGGTTGPWTAIDGRPLIECPRRTALGTQPSRGIPEGSYVMAVGHGRSVDFGELGGIAVVDPAGRLPLRMVQGLPAELTGAGVPPTPGLGASTIDWFGDRSDRGYVGTITVGSLGGVFEYANLYEVRVDLDLQAVQARVLARLGPFTGPEGRGFLDADMVPTDDGDPDLIGLVLDGTFDSGGSPLWLYDSSAGSFTRISATGLPQDFPTAMCVHPTGATVFLSLFDIPNNRAQIFAVPIAGGAARLVAVVPAFPYEMRCDPTGNIHLCESIGRYFRIDPHTGAVTSLPGTRPASALALAFEEASGDLITVNTTVIRIDAAGTRTEVFSLPGTGFGIPADMSIVPSPAIYGDGAPGDFGVNWDLPPGGARGLANLPIDSNAGFSIRLSSNGWNLLGAIGLATARAPAPGIDLLGMRLHLDPTATVLFVPFASGPAARLGLPVPAGIGRLSLYAQGFFVADGGYLVSSPGIKVTTIE